jgi:PAS domain S-box-containing protein
MTESNEQAKSGGEVFYDAFKSSPFGIVLEDLEGRPLFVNPAFCSMLGFSEEEMLTKHCVDFSPPEDAQKDWALFQQLRAGSIDHYHLDKRYFRRDGSLVWGRLSVSLLNHRPSPLVIAMVEDITEKMVAQETLELATEEAVSVTRCSRDFRYVWASHGYAKWLQRPLEQIVGRPIIDVLGKDAFETLSPHFERVLAGDKVSYEEEVSFAGIGSRWISANCTPAFDAVGVINGWVAVVVDITERKLAEEEQLQHAAIVESTDDAIISATLEGRIVSWNQGAQKLFGYTESEALGQPIEIIVPDGRRDEAKDIQRRVKNGEHIQRYETVRATKQGEQIDISMTISPIRNSHRKVVGACGIFRDISERKEFEKSLVWRLEFESLLSDLSRTFISLPEEEIGTNIEQAMARIGAFLQLDRITLFELSRDRTVFLAAYTWNGPGVGQAPRSVTSSDLPWWSHRVLAGHMSLISQLNDLPEEASAEKEYFRQSGIRCAASIPLNVAGEITGAITFLTGKRQVTWTADLVRQLRVIGDIFSNALKRKRAMEALSAAQMIMRESEERFRLVANTAPALIWMSGVDKRCTYFNERWLEFTGRSLESELGNGWTDSVHPEDLSRCWNIWNEAFDRREPFQLEYRLRRHDAQYRWVFDSGVPRFNLDGSFAGFIGSCVDITERRQAEAILSSFSQRLIQAQEQERTAVGRELHDDVNQRVVLAALNLDVLISQGDVAIPAEVKSEITLVMGQLRELASDIQALSYRLHSSKLEQLGLRGAAASFCREVSAKHKVKVDFEFEAVPQNVPTEISLSLFRVMQEALQNSTKHSGSTHFQVSLTGGSDEIKLTVRDSGKGFDPQEVLNAKGIGLASMKERMKLVNGQLFIQTEPGRGTAIFARVPFNTSSDFHEDSR